MLTFDFFGVRADNVLAEWAKLEVASTTIYNGLSSATKPAFFQLVHHPVIASNNLAKLVCYFFLAPLRNFIIYQLVDHCGHEQPESFTSHCEWL